MENVSKRGYTLEDNFIDTGSTTEALLRMATEERAKQIELENTDRRNTSESPSTASMLERLEQIKLYVTGGK